MRIVPAASAAVLLALSLTACGDDSEPTAEAGGTSCDYVEDGTEPAKEVTPPPATADVSGDVATTIDTSAGEIGLTLDAAAAPCTVNSFVSLAEQGWYDDTTCHRLTTQGIYVLQCGDPTGSGMGGPGYTIPDELSGNETYPAGTVAMAKTAAPDSGGSQFFLVYDDTQLPPDYTVFGQVDDAGLEVLRSIAKAGTATGAPDGPPKNEVTIESVTTG
ncbi:MAG TPA: peptidylprolyl isomerase [Nocardioides sp.]